MWFDRAMEMIKGTEGEIGFLVKNLVSGFFFGYREDEKFPSASTIKVPILLTLIDAAAEGSVDLDRVYPVLPGEIAGGSGMIRFLSGSLPFTLLDHAMMMIDVSDNTATNRVIDVAGMDKVNAKCRELGLKETVLGRKMMDFKARKQGRDNYTSCRDLLKVFEHIHNNPVKYSLALKLLTQQMHNDLLPHLIPREGFEFAHKTGSLEGIRHDAGIMYLRDPVFVALMTKDLKNEADGILLANRIGLLIYNEFMVQDIITLYPSRLP